MCSSVHRAGRGVRPVGGDAGCLRVGREAAEQDERGPEHLAAVALDVVAQCLHGRDVAGELFIESPLDPFEALKKGFLDGDEGFWDIEHAAHGHLLGRTIVHRSGPANPRLG